MYGLCLHSLTSTGKYSTLGASTAHFGANTAHFGGKYSTLSYSMENILIAYMASYNKKTIAGTCYCIRNILKIFIVLNFALAKLSRENMKFYTMKMYYDYTIISCCDEHE